jgi:phytoene synthase
LQTHGLTRSAVLKLQADPPLLAALRELGTRAHQKYDQALDQLPGSARWAQRPGLAMAAIYRDLLRAIEENPADVLTHRVSLGPARKLLMGMHGALGRLPR